MTRECHVRFCERLRVKFPGPTRRPRAGMELQNGSNFEVLTPYSWPESNILPAQMACGGGASRSRRPHARGEVLSVELGRSHPCPASTPDRPMKATAERWACTRMRSRTAALYR